jgi:hypothetical protein
MSPSRRAIRIVSGAHKAALCRPPTVPQGIPFLMSIIGFVAVAWPVWANRLEKDRPFVNGETFNGSACGDVRDTERFGCV